MPYLENHSIAVGIFTWIVNFVTKDVLKNIC